LHITPQRLGAVAASTTISAANGNSISHEKFMRGTAAVAPNRKLAEVLFHLQYRYIMHIYHLLEYLIKTE
jgi:hypothetical protein